MTRSEKEQIMENLRLQNHDARLIEENMALCRDLRYEMKDTLLHMDGLLKDGKIQELKNYLDEKICLQNTITDMVDTGRPLISTLLNQKRAYAREQGTEMDIQVVLPGNVPLSDGELIMILGNLLDNAIDECAGQEHGKIVLIVRPVKGYLFISVSNTVRPDDALNLKQMQDSNIRLKTVQYVADIFDGMVSCKMRDDNTFTVECMLGLAGYSGLPKSTGKTSGGHLDRRQ